MVPYEQNPRFTARTSFLQKLKQRMFAQNPKQYNHRIALYGMGGVGKTQCALEYVYSNAATYKRIYWITAIDQASFLSGYEKIGTKARLPLNDASKPFEI